MADSRRRRRSSGGRRPSSASERYELDLFTVLTALGSGLHRDRTPISDEGQYALAKALVRDAAGQGWSFAGTPTHTLYDAVRSARSLVVGPFALIPVEIAQAEILIELGVDPAGPTNLDGLLAAGSAVAVIPGLFLLAARPGLPRSATRSVVVKLPGKSP